MEHLQGPEGAPTHRDASHLLSQAGATTVERPGDRRTHATSVAAVGLLWGLWAGAYWATAGARWEGLITAALQVVALVALIALVVHRERRVRTVPRGVRRTAMVGALCTGLLFLVAAFPTVDRGAGGLPAALAIAVGVAAPAVWAAARVARAPR
ncbi:hypothetical protein ACNHYB_12750 [Isoptericola jiangsuensis]|uniref:hypothetical protein n=1 Tax=Isoptericola jiangsuensis TaxID=548579 RepID=UPI003AACCC87